MTANLLKQLRKPVRLLAAGVLGLSSFGFAGCVHSPDDLFSGRTDRLHQRFASKPSGRAEAERESQRLARSLALGWNDDETADPFLREDRRKQKPGDVEIASRRTADDRTNRQAELIAGAQERPATTKSQTAKRAVEKPSTGTTVQMTRPQRDRRRNFEAELAEALAETTGSDDVELLTAPPGKATVEAAPRPPAAKHDPSPVKLNRPIPGDEQSVSANRSAAVSEVPPVVAVSKSPRIEKAAVPSRSAAEPFVVRIRPAIPTPAAIPANAPRIARVNANQGAQDVSTLTQSFHTQETRSPTGPSVEQMSNQSVQAPPSAPPSITGPTLAAPTNAASPLSVTSTFAPPSDLQQAALPLTQSRTSPVQLEATVEPEDDAQPLALAMTPRPVGSNSFSADHFATEVVPPGPNLGATPTSPAPMTRKSDDASPPSSSVEVEVVTPTPASPASIWIWLGSLCGVCGLSGLLVFSRLERRRFAQAAVLARRQNMPRKWGAGRKDSAPVAASANRRAA